MNSPSLAEFKSHFSFGESCPCPSLGPGATEDRLFMRQTFLLTSFIQQLGRDRRISGFSLVKFSRKIVGTYLDLFFPFFLGGLRC